MAQGQQYQVPPGGLRPELVQMLGAAPNVPEAMRERIIQAPVQQRVVRVENQPIDDAVLAELMAMGVEFNPAEAAALEMDANRVPAAVP